jgi:hypothetical protein
MIFDINNLPEEPLDDADPDLNNEREYYLEQRGFSINIAPGDWVDVNTGAITQDETYGISFQVSRTLEDCIYILVNENGKGYKETQLSMCWVLNNYRRT